MTTPLPTPTPARPPRTRAPLALACLLASATATIGAPFPGLRPVEGQVCVDGMDSAPGWTFALARPGAPPPPLAFQAHPPRRCAPSPAALFARQGRGAPVATHFLSAPEADSYWEFSSRVSRQFRVKSVEGGVVTLADQGLLRTRRLPWELLLLGGLALALGAQRFGSGATEVAEDAAEPAEAGDAAEPAEGSASDQGAGSQPAEAGASDQVVTTEDVPLEAAQPKGQA